MQRKIEDVLRESAKAAAQSKKKRKLKERDISYNETGRKIKEKLKTWQKIIFGITAIIAAIACIIYIPPMFYNASSEDSYVALTPDPSALKTYQQYAKDNPDADFDGDGLSNASEYEHGTNIWNVDSDNDGVNDYAELNITNTSPTSASSVQVDMIMAQDKESGVTIRTPYKIDDIIFWPDDYVSKSYGAVVRTLNGYRFWNFSGYVKFPTTVYAYEYTGGIHKPLAYRAAEDAYHIDTHNEIRIYDKALEFTNELRLPFCGSIYMNDGRIGSFLSSILPDVGGPITCQYKAIVDTEPDTSGEVTSVLDLPSMDFSNLDRFGKNQNTLKDLSNVRKQVEAGYCVAVSLYSEYTGESIGIVYGYDAYGNLLVANTSLQPVGKLQIIECAKRVMNADGVIGQMSWFEFVGLGFNSSKYGDRINFFASTVTAVNNTEPEKIASSAEKESELQTDVPAEEPGQSVQAEEDLSQTELPTSSTHVEDTESTVVSNETDISTVIQEESDEQEYFASEIMSESETETQTEAEPTTETSSTLVTFTLE